MVPDAEAVTLMVEILDALGVGSYEIKVIQVVFRSPISVA
jgi:hypothetical protein